LGLCKFIIKANIGPERLAEIVNSALDWDVKPEEFVEAGDRFFQLKRLINSRLGASAADDGLPKRFREEPRPSGEAAGVLPDMELMLPVYYGLRDWGSDGRPSLERLERLGLV